jgi:hypothetical protein
MTDVEWAGGGFGFGCALTVEHMVVCWGDNAQGSLGNPGFLADAPTPVVWHP